VIKIYLTSSTIIWQSRFGIKLCSYCTELYSQWLYLYKSHSSLVIEITKSNSLLIVAYVIGIDRMGPFSETLCSSFHVTFCRLGLSTLYLCTHDKQDFYQHLGYQFCCPVLSFGSASNILSEQQASFVLFTLCFELKCCLLPIQ